jgi:hypothetical protein
VTRRRRRRNPLKAIPNPLKVGRWIGSHLGGAAVAGLHAPANAVQYLRRGGGRDHFAGEDISAMRGLGGRAGSDDNGHNADESDGSEGRYEATGAFEGDRRQLAATLRNSGGVRAPEGRLRLSLAALSVLTLNLLLTVARSSEAWLFALLCAALNFVVVSTVRSSQFFWRPSSESLGARGSEHKAQQQADAARAQSKRSLGPPIAHKAGVFSPVAASSFMVRQLDYMVLKQKGPSADAMLFGPIEVRVFRSERKVHHVGRELPLPPYPSDAALPGASARCAHPLVPDFFVVAFQIPWTPPSAFGNSSNDGPGVTMVVYYAFPPALKALLADAAESGVPPAAPGPLLLWRLLGTRPPPGRRAQSPLSTGSDSNAPRPSSASPPGGAAAPGAGGGAPPGGRHAPTLTNDDPDPKCIDDDGETRKIIDRMKLIGKALTPEKLPVGAVLGSQVTRYNGKPVLLRPQHEYYRGRAYFEQDIDVHRFTYPSQKLLNIVTQHECAKTNDFSVAMVSEGRSNAELPEHVLWCVHLGAPNLGPESGHATLEELRESLERAAETSRDASAGGGGAGAAEEKANASRASGGGRRSRT